MKRVLNFSIALLTACTTLLACGCMSYDKNTLFDQNTSINNLNWPYVDKVKFDVKVDDPSALYNVYLNLRVTADYKYSNLFVLIHQTDPDKKTTTVRQEYTLANPDGEWLGEGSGNLYSYQLPSKMRCKFAEKGTYHFEIEQNMRDNPLRQVSDVGLRVEKAE